MCDLTDSIQTQEVISRQQTKLKYFARTVTETLIKLAGI